MSVRSPSGRDSFHNLSPTVCERLERMLERFEDAWRAGERPALDDYLTGSEPERRALLIELVHAELHYRLTAGEAACVEDYLQRFPELRDDRTAALDLIGAEYQLRRGRTSGCAPHDYLGRFPEYGSELAARLPTLPAADAAPNQTPSSGARSGRASVPVAQPTMPGYKVADEIGRGGMGAVFRARDLELGRDLAVKVLLDDHQSDPALELRFIEEAQIAGQLQHPGIVPVHALGRLANGRPYFTMKLVQGRTLAALLAARPRPDHDEARFLSIFAQVCQTLAYAHSRGVIHRDLKPANVMVGAFGEVQVMDWGLAKVLGPAQAVESSPAPSASANGSTVRTLRSETAGLSSQAGAVLGTPAYMAPEQALGQVDQLDERCDVFGLGAMLCEILTGQPPYFASSSGEAHLQAAECKLGAAWQRLEQCQVDAELVALAKACLSPRREDRPRSAAAVAEAVTAYQAGVQERLRTAELERTQARVQAAEERKRRRLAVGLAAALIALLALVAGSGLWLQHQRGLDAAQRALLAQTAQRDVDEALAQAVSFRRQFRFTDAATLLSQAQGRLDKNQDADELRERLQQAQSDVSLAAKLDSIRVARVTLIRGMDDTNPSASAYAKAFPEYDFDVIGGDLAEVVARINSSPLREELIVALDDWIVVEPERGKLARVDRLIEVACRLDPDPENNALRGRWRDREAFLRQVRAADMKRMSPGLVQMLSLRLGQTNEESLALLQRALQQYPRDFVLNIVLANRLAMKARWDEAIGYWRVAIALRPDSAYLYGGLGATLGQKGDRQGALAAYRKAIECDPKDAKTHYNLGVWYLKENDRTSALAAFRKAAECNPQFAKAHLNVGVCLYKEGDRRGAIAAFRKAAEFDLKDANPPCYLGVALNEEGEWNDAITAFREALRRAPEHASAQEQLYRCQRLLGLEEQLPAILQGKVTPRNAAEQIEFAHLCTLKKLYAAAARLSRDAFAADPKVAELVPSAARYNAACVAALACCGQGKDADQLNDQERARWRQQTRDWLRADLTWWAKVLDNGDARAKADVPQTMRHWQTDPDLAGVRDPDAVSKLPSDERTQWRQLWDDVAALLKRVEERK